MAKRILFLISDTGGGHRASANAIIEGLELDYPGQYETQMIDFLKDYAPPPLKFSPEIYRPMARMRMLWKGGYEWSNDLRRSRTIDRMTYPMMRRSAEKLLEENPADIIVAVHPLANYAIPRAMDTEHHVPFVTVVTDMVSTHAFWYSPRADLVIVPTMQARNRGIRFGIDPEKLQVIGQPVSPKFAEMTTPKEELRHGLGWDEGVPVVLVVSGGDGMGPVRRVARVINDAQLPVSLAVICGHNESLVNELESMPWAIPHHIYGFTKEMPRFMKAADIFVTKAGPGSISEAFICGLPIIMYACMPGQEEGNVDYVLDGGAGFWAPRPETVIDTISSLVSDKSLYDEVADAGRKLARPDSARQIAQAIVEQMG